MRSGITAITTRQLVNDNLLKLMNEGLLVLDRHNCIDMVNDAALNLLGYVSDEDMVGKHVSEIYAFPDALENLIALYQQGENIHNWENTFIKSDGSTFSGSYSLKTINDDIGEPVIKMILFRDITAEKNYTATIEEHTKNLEKSYKELDQFAYIVSHDLKAPLRALTNLSIWLEEDLGATLSEENKTGLAMLRGRVLRMEALINGILEYSRIGRSEVPCESVDINMLVKEATDLLSPPAHFSIEIQNDMPSLEAPKVMLLQVFTNLIGNAIKYNNRKEGIIKITAVDRDKYFEFAVEDNGPGILPEHHERIFMIFQTLHSRDRFESTGVGLTIVKRILTSRGGKVWVESEPDKGSKFIFTWPKSVNEQSKNS